ncbi:hypothetical protein [Hyalangium versicolor]|uniref:hypothetical protein n=1 Tax=Hyalangium versicolor TaxID=2861190 RepID=UPI001CCF428D|nr:hypothetical protein [Hyalangium versicolor]
MGLLPKRSILSKLHSGKQFDSLDEVQEFERRLAAELEKGTVERIPVGKLYSHTTPEEWYREREAGIVYRYIPPEFPLKGRWERVENPEERSYFEQLSREDQPTQEQYAQLSAELEERWRRGEIERALNTNSKIAGTWIYHHPPSDETFELYPPLQSTKRAIWQKIFRSEKDGSWPGELKKDIPPARGGTERERK